MATNMTQKFMATGRIGYIDEKLGTVGRGANAISVLHFTVGIKASTKLADNEVERKGETLWEAPSGDVYAQSTMWVRCTLWGPYAEAMDPILEQGMLVQVEGELAYDLETGGPNVFAYNDGTAGAKFELNRVNLHILARPNGAPFDGDTPENELDEAMGEDPIEPELEPEPVPARRRSARAQAEAPAPARSRVAARTTTPTASRRPARVASSPNGQASTQKRGTSTPRRTGRAPY